MRPYGYKAYRGRSGTKLVLTFLVAVLVVILALALIFFFFAQQYIVYGDDGKAHVDLPFLQAPSPSPPPSPVQSPNLIVIVTPSPSAAPTPTAAPQSVLTAVELPLTALTDGSAADRVAAAGGSAAVFTMKGPDGMLAYVSSLETAIQAETSAADPALNDAIRALNDGELYTVARVSCFKDDAGPKSFPYRDGVNLYSEIGNWRDADGVRWYSPAAPQARDYLAGICAELAGLGFDEILLENCAFPTEGSLNRIVRGDSYNEATFTEDLDEFYVQVREALADYPQVRLSITAAPGVMAGDPADKSGQTLELLKTHADRVWFPAPGEADWSAAREELGREGAQMVCPEGDAPADAGRVGSPPR